MNSDISLPSHLKENLKKFRKRVRSIKLRECLLASFYGLLASYCLVYGLDRLWDTPGEYRLGILILGCMGFAIYMPRQLQRWFWGLEKLTNVAKVIRKKMPRFGDQLLGIIELTDGEQRNASQTLIKAALQQVDEETKNRDLSPAVPSTRSKLWAGMVLPFVAITTALGILTPEAANNAFKRWSQPLSNIERYTFTDILPLPDKMIVPFAEAFTVEVKIDPESRLLPTEAEAQYLTQRPIVIPANENTEQVYRFEIPPQRANGDLVIKAGDDVATIQIIPTLRPEITSMQAKVKLPEYLQYDQTQTHEARSGSLTLLKGSEFSMKAELSRELKSATINGQPNETNGTHLSTKNSTPIENHTLTLNWQDIHGLTPLDPFEVTITLIEDQPPSILIQGVEREQFLLTSETLPLDLTANDDYGIRQMGIEWIGIHDPIENPEPHKGEKLAKMGEPQARTLQARTTFNPLHLKISPQTIRLRAYVEDYSPLSKRIYSPPILLHILNPEEHALHVTELYKKWQRGAQEIYERELQLNDRNKSLREMSASDLSKPETQRAISDQARAEEYNARQLDDHTKSGEELLKQATRNPNFEGDQLENWAETLQTLNDIAEKRMPSVADLLQKASDEANKPPQDSKPSDPQENVPMAINDQSKKSGSQGQESNEKKKPFPSIKDIESSLADNKTPEPSAKPNSGGSPRLSLPTTTVAGSNDDNESNEQPQSPAQETLDQANKEQEELIKEFAKVSDKLNDILKDLEGSTFVKRLKAASREQIKIAASVNSQVVDGFGLNEPLVPLVSKQVVEKQNSQARKISVFLEDLDAYAARVEEPLYESILAQMQDHTIQPQLTKIAATLGNHNHSGNNISASEYWADQFDIWADQLVKANESACKAKPGKKKNSASIPPDLILAVMRVLREQVDLREDTRSVENTRTDLELEEYEEQVAPLQEKQYELAARTKGVVEALLKLPNARQKFNNEMGLLAKVSEVMFEAEDILGEPDTGARAIAAETEAIELLLQAKKACGNCGGGGGGGNSPGGGGSGSTTQSALAMIGEGNDKKAKVQKRKVGQSTGTSGALLPAEFKSGLDAYFHALENL